MGFPPADLLTPREQCDASSRCRSVAKTSARSAAARSFCAPTHVSRLAYARQLATMRSSCPPTANLDTDMFKYLQEWFPREIKAKEKANQKEAAREELEEMGLKEHKCLLM